VVVLKAGDNFETMATNKLDGAVLANARISRREQLREA
jgi:hypothetical protein